MNKTTNKEKTQNQIVNEAKLAILDNIGIKYDMQDKQTKSICLNAKNINDIDNLFVEYAKKLLINSNKNANAINQLVAMSNKLQSNTIKKRIYATAMLDNTATKLQYDGKVKAYTTETIKIRLSDFVKSCYNLIMFELDNKNTKNTIK